MQRAASSLTKFIGHRWILRQRTNALLTDVYRAEALRICGITGAMVDHGDSDLCGARAPCRHAISTMVRTSRLSAINDISPGLANRVC
jgi:hypothetical protein